MTYKRVLASCVLLVALGAFVATPSAAPPTGPVSSVFVQGLHSPVKVIITPGHQLLVSEAGQAQPNFVPHDGRISIIDRSGNIRTLIGHLPSGLDLENTSPSGPGAIWLQGQRTLLIAFSPGDVQKRNAMNQEVSNPIGPSSSLFSSIWRVRFSESVDWLGGDFELNPAIDFATLTDGKTVKLTNDLGECADIEVLADVRDIMPGGNLIAASNPWGLLVAGDSVYFPDAGYNSLAAANRVSGRIETITHFPNVPNTAPFGPPFSQAVPNSIRGLSRERYALVTLFSGFPFGRGASSVRLVDLMTGQQQPLISGLTMAIDTLPLGNWTNKLLVLEHASAFVPPGPAGPAQFVSPGRILQFATPSSAPQVLVDTLVTPTSMNLDAETGDLFVTEIRTGRIIKISLY
jgi:hypothetical protein